MFKSIRTKIESLSCHVIFTCVRVSYNVRNIYQFRRVLRDFIEFEHSLSEFFLNVAYQQNAFTLFENSSGSVHCHFSCDCKENETVRILYDTGRSCITTHSELTTVGEVTGARKSPPREVTCFQIACDARDIFVRYSKFRVRLSFTNFRNVALNRFRTNLLDARST